MTSHNLAALMTLLRLVALIAVLGCERASAAGARPVAYAEIFRLAQENMILYPRPRIFCLARGMDGAQGEDSTVVAAVQRLDPRARPLETCVGTMAGDSAQTVALRPSPDQYLVWVKAVGRPSLDRAVFDGGYSASGLLAAEWRCAVVREASVWRIVEPCTMRWFS